MRKRWMAVLLALLAALLPAGAGLGEEEGPEGQDNPAEEYILEDEDAGVWQYAGEGLEVRITRYREDVTYKRQKRTREYYVAEILASPEQPLSVIQTQALKTKPAGYKLASPELLLEEHPAVFALSDDMYGLRIQKYDYQGVVIRNGEILTTKTRDSSSGKYRRSWPNLDTLAVYGDGSMKTFVCDALTAEEYLEQGAVNVFAFGPILVSGGEVSENVMNAMDAGYNEPRAAIGMIEPWHYIAVMVRGRPTSRYAGVHLDWLADKMKELGCVEALNLDGGLTATMAFRGKIIGSGGEKLRSQGSMITFGAGLGTAEPAAAAQTGPRTARTAKAKVNVRAEMDPKSARVAQIAKKGTQVTVTEESRDADGTLWYRIQTESGKEGYVRGDMLKEVP